MFCYMCTCLCSLALRSLFYCRHWERSYLLKLNGKGSVNLALMFSSVSYSFFFFTYI